MRWLWIVALGLVGGGLLWWVSEQGSRPMGVAPVEVAELGGRPQGHVYTGIVEEPVTVNPFAASSPAAISGVLRFTMDALLDWDPVTGGLRPGLASSWEVEGDGRTVRFGLRPGARFANGAPVTRDAVLFTWQVLQRDPMADTQLGSVLARVRDVRAPARAPDQVVVELVAPGAANVAAVATGYWVVHPPSLLEQVGVPLEADDFVERLQQHRGTFVGSGPYQLRPGDWRFGQDVLLTRNIHSWHRVARPGTWNFGGIRWLFAQAAGVPLLALEEGRIDFLPAQDPAAMFDANPGLAERFRVVDYLHPLMQPYRIAWNCRRAPMDDVRVRRAVALLAPRQELVDSLLGGRGTVASGPFAPGHPATVAPLGGDGGDAQEARELLEAAGYGAERPLEFELLVPSEDRFFVQMADLLVESWRKAGVRVAVQTMENTALTERLHEREFDGAMFTDFDPIPLRDIYPLLHSSQGDHNNLMGYASDAVDGLLDEVRRGGSPEAQQRALRAVCEHLRADQPVLWLVHRRVLLILDRRIEDAAPGPLGLNPESFWVAPAQQRR